MNPVETIEAGKAVNPLKQLLKYGQSVWLDYIRRNLITSGELKRLIDEDGLRGMTSNPSIFEKAIAGSTDYTDFLNSLRDRTDLDAKARYELLAIRDIQDAADLMRPVYDSAKRKDGFVSLEVSPYLAHDTQGTIAEARPLEIRKPRQCDDQSAGHGGRPPRDQAIDQRRHEHQRHLALFPASL